MCCACVSVALLWYDWSDNRCSSEWEGAKKRKFFFNFCRIILKNEKKKNEKTVMKKKMIVYVCMFLTIVSSVSILQISVNLVQDSSILMLAVQKKKQKQLHHFTTHFLISSSFLCYFLSMQCAHNGTLCVAWQAREQAATSLVSGLLILRGRKINTYCKNR